MRPCKGLVTLCKVLWTERRNPLIPTSHKAPHAKPWWQTSECAQRARHIAVFTQHRSISTNFSTSKDNPTHHRWRLARQIRLAKPQHPSRSVICDPDVTPCLPSQVIDYLLCSLPPCNETVTDGAAPRKYFMGTSLDDYKKI